MNRYLSGTSDDVDVVPNGELKMHAKNSDIVDLVLSRGLYMARTSDDVDLVHGTEDASVMALMWRLGVSIS